MVPALYSGCGYPHSSVWLLLIRKLYCHKFLKKGSKCCIIGKIQNSSYEKDGVTRYTTDIVADEVEFLGGKNTDGDVAPKPADTNGSADLEPIDDDSLPF